MLVRAANIVLFLLFLLITAAGNCAISPDARLLPLVPPESAIVAGIHATSETGLPGNFLMVSRSNRIDMDDFLALTGADTSRVLHEIIFIADGVRDPVVEHSLLASGVFNQSAIFKYADGARA